jgi:hypothetical protein
MRPAGKDTGGTNPSAPQIAGHHGPPQVTLHLYFRPIQLHPSGTSHAFAHQRGGPICQNNETVATTSTTITHQPFRIYIFLSLSLLHRRLSEDIHDVHCWVILFSYRAAFGFCRWGLLHDTNLAFTCLTRCMGYILSRALP